MEKKKTIWKIVKNYLNKNLLISFPVSDLFAEIEKEYGLNYTKAGVYRILFDLEKHRFLSCVNRKKGKLINMRIFPFNSIPADFNTKELRTPFCLKKEAVISAAGDFSPKKKTWRQKINLFLKFFSWKNNSLGSIQNLN